MRIILISILVFLPIWAMAQDQNVPMPKAEPVDEAEQDQSFLIFRDALLAAVVKRDIETILAMSAEDIVLSFGGSDGRDAFRDFLEVDPNDFGADQKYEAPAMRERNWADLETVLRMGGVFNEQGDFVAPYTWAAEHPEEADPFEVMFVTGSGVALRERPIRFGDVLGRLDYDVVTFRNWVSGTSFVEIEKADGVVGFVHRDFVRFLVDYRAFFSKTDGNWKMTRFIAGD
jgi:hypothetical protein